MTSVPGWRMEALPEWNDPLAFGVRALDQPVELFRLEKDHRVRIFDRCHEKAFDVGRGRGNHHLEPGNVGVQGFDRLGVVQGPVDAASERNPNDDRTRPAAVASITDSGCLRNDLIEGGVDVVGELDLGDGALSRRRHPDRGSGDERL